MEKKEIEKAWCYRKAELTGGMYTDEPMRGPNVQTVELIDRLELLRGEPFFTNPN